jgi:cell division protein FtsL
MSEPMRSDGFAVTVVEAKPPRSPKERSSVSKTPRGASTRARAKAQAREARQPRHAAAKSAKASAAAALQADPLEVEGTPQARQRHLQLVADRRQLRLARRHRARLLLAMAASCAVVVAFGLVYLRVIAAQRQFTLDNLNTQVTQQEATYQRLQLQVAQLNSPDRIVGYAETKLGMVPSTSVPVLTPSVASSPPSTSTSPTQAPAGDADYPSIKALMAGTP